jgi:hypothetical protein
MPRRGRVIWPVGGGTGAADETGDAISSEEVVVAGEETDDVAVWETGDTGIRATWDNWSSPSELEGGLSASSASHAREAGARAGVRSAAGARAGHVTSRGTSRGPALARPGAARGGDVLHVGTKPEEESAEPPTEPLHGSTQLKAGLAGAAVAHGCT